MIMYKSFIIKDSANLTVTGIKLCRFLNISVQNAAAGLKSLRNSQKQQYGSVRIAAAAMSKSSFRFSAPLLSRDSQKNAMAVVI